MSHGPMFWLGTEIFSISQIPNLGGRFQTGMIKVKLKVRTSNNTLNNYGRFHCANKSDL